MKSEKNFAFLYGAFFQNSKMDIGVNINLNKKYYKGELIYRKWNYFMEEKSVLIGQKWISNFNSHCRMRIIIRNEDYRT